MEPLFTGPPDHRVAVGIVIYNESDQEGVARGAAIWAASIGTVVEIWPTEIGRLARKQGTVIVGNPAPL